jgi:hypothetical protein
LQKEERPPARVAFFFCLEGGRRHFYAPRNLKWPPKLR